MTSRGSTAELKWTRIPGRRFNPRRGTVTSGWRPSQSMSSQCAAAAKWLSSASSPRLLTAARNPPSRVTCACPTAYTPRKRGWSRPPRTRVRTVPRDNPHSRSSPKDSTPHSSAAFAATRTSARGGTSFDLLEQSTASTRAGECSRRELRMPGSVPWVSCQNNARRCQIRAGSVNGVRRRLLLCVVADPVLDRLDLVVDLVLDQLARPRVLAGVGRHEHDRGDDGGEDQDHEEEADQAADAARGRAS